MRHHGRCGSAGPFMGRRSHDRPHVSPGWDGQETPAQAFVREMSSAWKPLLMGRRGKGMVSDKGDGLPSGSRRPRSQGTILRTAANA